MVRKGSTVRVRARASGTVATPPQDLPTRPRASVRLTELIATGNAADFVE
jgi:hypothetical protein